MDKGAQPIIGLILVVFGGFNVYTNGMYLFAYEQCATCSTRGPSTNMDAGIGLLIGCLLLLAAVSVFNSKGRAGCLTRIVAAMCLIYIIVTLAGLKGFVSIPWSTEHLAQNMIAAGLGLVLSVKRLRDKP